MLFLGGLLPGHVPTYGGCRENCCTPPHSHKTSQVIYMQGSGGLEFHVKSYSEPFDINGSEIIDFDAVFRDSVDPSTYALYVGCGGCMTHDPIVASPAAISGYQSAVVEPFTQTVYRSAFHKDNRKFSAALLSPSLCPQQHFTIRLVDFKNRSDGKPIVWAPVVGLGESFTFVELLSFPLFILKNHGSAWTGLDWTWWLCLFLAPVVILAHRELRRCLGSTTSLSSRAVWIAKGQKPGLYLRGVLYYLAVVFFVASALEMLLHLVVSQVRVCGESERKCVGEAYLVSMFAVILLPHALGVAFTWYVWRKMHESRGRDRQWRRNKQGHVRALLATLVLLAVLTAFYTLTAVFKTLWLAACLLLVVLAVVAILLCWSDVWDAVAELVEEMRQDHGSPFWAPLEVATGFAFLFLFGVGLFGGPVCVMLAGLVRMQEMFVDVNLGTRVYLSAEAATPGPGPPLALPA